MCIGEHIAPLGERVQVESEHGSKVEQLEANIEALDIVLSPDQIKYLESVFPFEMGVPDWHCVSFL